MCKLDHKESWALKSWCFWTVVLEKTLESPLGCKEIQPVHPKGDESWMFIERTDVEAETPVLWPPDKMSWLIGKDPDAGKDWELEEKWTAEDEIAGWHHQLNAHEFGWTPGVGNGQGGLMCCKSESQRVGHDWETELNWRNLETNIPIAFRKKQDAIIIIISIPILFITTWRHQDPWACLLRDVSHLKPLALDMPSLDQAT